MAQDIRDLFKKEKMQLHNELSGGHEARFMKLLDEALPEKQKPKLSWLKVAAAILILVSVSMLAYTQFAKEDIMEATTAETSEKKQTTKKTQMTLGDISPDLQKIENYYLANINYELTQMEVSKEGKAVFDSYMLKLAKLNDEHKSLIEKLNISGPNESVINAVIDNLQFRLKLLYQLKEKLNELKKSRNEM